MVGRMRSQTRADLDAMVEDLRLLTERATRLRGRLAAMTVTARSTDGCVTATVNAHGDLDDLAIDPVLARSIETRALAGRVVEAVRAAAARARRRREDVMAEMLPPRLRDRLGDDLPELPPEFGVGPR